MQSSFKNFYAAYASNTAFTMTADEITVEDASGNTSRVSSLSVTVNTATTGANGCDVALSDFSANSWAYGYVIQKPDGTKAGLLSASASAPTLPSGYTFKSGPVTAVRLDASKNIVGFTQVGRKWQYLVGSNLSTPPQVCTGTQGTYGSASASVSVSAVVPTAIASLVKFLYSAVASSGYSMAVSPNANYGHGGVSMTNPPYFGNPYGGVCQAVPFEMMLESSSIRVESEASATLFALGFDINV